MTDAFTPNRVPRPPRAPASAGVRSASSIADGNDLLLVAQRKHLATKKASSVSSAPVVGNRINDTSIAEVERLKEVLRASQKRLATPSQNGSVKQRKQNASSNGVGNGLSGERYAPLPYDPIQPRVMWESFEQDPEVKLELQRLKQSEERLAQRHEAWSAEWIRARKVDDKARIAAPTPPVFAATDDEHVLALANAAEHFMHTGSPRKLRHDTTPPNTKLDDERAARTSSPIGSRSLSRATPTLVRRTSSVRANTALLAHLGLDNCVELDLPDPQEVVSDRGGDILGGAFILKRDLFDAAFTRKDVVGVMAGAPAFRLIPRFNVGALAQAHQSGIKTILNEITRHWQGPIVWVSLREEPIVYINNRAYTVRAADAPLEPIPTPGIKADRLEELENKLRGEVLREGTRFGGNVIVHREAGTGSVDALWEAVDEGSVVTLRAAFEQITASGYDVRYLRLPVTAHLGVTLNQFDVMFDLCQRHPIDPLIVSCQTGRGRSTVAMIIATLVRFYQHNLNKGRIRTHMSLLNRDEFSPGLQKLVQLVALLPDGRDHEYRVSILCELTGKASNLPDRILTSLKSEEVSTTGTALLSRYCHLVAFSGYCSERLVSKSTNLTFSEWVHNNKALDLLLGSFTDADDESTREIPKPPTLIDPATDAASLLRRDGEVLVNGMALVSYQSSGPPSPFPGIVALRQVDMRVPIFTCGRSTHDARCDLLYNVCSTFKTSPRVDWIDARAEPYIYINRVAYAASMVHSIFHEHLNSMRVTGESIEDVERLLKMDVQHEARVNGGFVDVMCADTDALTLTRIRIRITDVLTPREYAAQITSQLPIVYHRVPFSAGDTLNVLAVHSIIDVARNAPNDSIAVIEDTTGGLRSTVALNIFCLARLSNIRPLASVSTETAVRELLSVADFVSPISTSISFGGQEEAELLGKHALKKELLIAASIAQMLAAGSILMATESVCGICGRGKEWNLVDRANILVNELTGAVGDTRLAATHAALATAVTYVYIYLAAVYVTEMPRDSTLRFEDWVQGHLEIRLMLEKMHDHPEESLKFVEPQNLFLDTESGSVERRRGNVLTSNFGLKADHFPGAIRKGMVPEIPGVPNFRKVKYVNVYGVGIPTKRGIFNLLMVLGALKGTPDVEVTPELLNALPRIELYHPDAPVPSAIPSGRVVWVNMREEPLLYVGDRPFVLRNLANPYVNVELTGITPAKIEAIEAALAIDCLEDAKKYNNQFLVHDEIKPGVMGGLWEPGNEVTIQTVRQIYDAAAAQFSAKVSFFRLPVTDEQMPEITDFDLLVQAVLPDILANTDFPDGECLSLVFNCQMGRGRTTTGMAIACMLIGIVDNDYYRKLEATHPDLYPSTASKWSNGHYTVIQDLMRILVDGREAKRRVDLVLAACDTLQNLRTAIETFKIQYESPDVSEKQRATAVHHGQHYLMRYFFLIVFNSYLHEAWDPTSRRLRMTFVAYMQPRDELRHFADRCELK